LNGPHDHASLVSRAPADCRQYFTGTAGTVKSYNYGGSLMLAAQQYTNCFRQELGDIFANTFFHLLDSLKN
jgi:hypothetical protein